MMAVLWKDVADDIASSKLHFGHGVAMYDRDLAGTPLMADYMPSMAFQHAMQSGYTSFEAAAKRLLAMLDESVPVGPDAHAALLRRLGQPQPGARPALFDAEFARVAEELRRFRHVAIHSYDAFEPARAVPAVEAARAFLGRVDTVFAVFRAAIDPD